VASDGKTYSDLASLQERHYSGVFHLPERMCSGTDPHGESLGREPQLELINNLGKLTGVDNVELE
jgi:hypothetical protein